MVSIPFYHGSLSRSWLYYRGAFSLWQSPITLPSSCLGRGGHAKDVNTIMDRVSRDACSRTKMDVTAASNKDVTFTSAMTQSSVRATNRENETWAKIARRGFGEGPTYAAPCRFEDNRGSLKDTCIHCIASAAHVANAGKACATASREFDQPFCVRLKTAWLYTYIWGSL